MKLTEALRNLFKPKANIMDTPKYSPELQAAVEAFLNANQGNGASRETISASLAENIAKVRAEGMTDEAILADLKKAQAITDTAARLPATTPELLPALKAARNGLATALRVMNANGIHMNSPERGAIESAHDNAHNAVNSNQPKPGLLAAATAALKVAAHLLANHSLKTPEDLTAVKEAHAAAENAANRLNVPTPSPEPASGPI